jgi:hypothetical protein
MPPHDERTELAIRGAEIAERLHWLALHNFVDTAPIQRALSDELQNINERLTAPPRRSS